MFILNGTIRRPSELDPGQIQFVDNWLPALHAAHYRVAVTQSVTADQSGADYGSTRDFEVAGPQFRIEGSDVHSVYPAANSQGADPYALPYAVIRRPGLPWERLVDPEDPEDVDTPWLALLLLDVGDIVPPDGATIDTNPTLVGNYAVSDVVSPPDARILGSQLHVSEAEGKVRAQAVDVSTKVWDAIMPGRDEVQWLAHVRSVDTEDKAIDGLAQDVDGTFAILFANRYPQSGGSQIAHLVSLEGMGKYLPGGGSAVTDYDAVRLVSLRSWTFSGAGRTETFPKLMEDLDVDLMRLPCDVPAGWSDPPTDAQQIALDGFRDGYVPMDYTTRLGQHTIGWVRGPLLPARTEDASLQPFLAAEAALVYDERVGLFDVSYAVAWQMGRLLALSDRGFSDAVLAWRKRGNRKMHLLTERVRQMRRLGGVGLRFEDPRELLDEGMVHGFFRDFLVGRLGPRIVGARGKAPILGRLVDHSGVLDRLGLVPGVLDLESFAALLAAGADPNTQLSAWLKRAGEDA